MKILDSETTSYQANFLLDNGTIDVINSYHFLERVDILRLDACRQLKQSQKGQMGQFLTPAPVARLMASMLNFSLPSVSLLDAGAGIGSLFAACVAELCQRQNRPQQINITAYEIDVVLAEYLKSTIKLCQAECERVGIAFTSEIRQVDFIKDAARLLNGDLFSKPLTPTFTCAILNPPYRKINANSETRKVLGKLGIETSNIYTGFLAATVKLLAPCGELVAITPRSFCNGLYFRNFRASFFEEMALRHLHLFDSRQEAFRDDKVLQETIILYAAKQAKKPEKIFITSSSGAEDELILSHELNYEQVINPKDPEMFIRIVPDGMSQQVVERMAYFKASLADLGLSVSTGRVVDFRAKQYLRLKLQEGTVPLIYPTHFAAGYVSWPKKTNKAQALVIAEETQNLIVPNEHYVLVKRFSPKEEKKRIVAALYDAQRLPGTGVGFENHLNYFHQKGRGLDITLARGLATFLNSSLVDSFFRQFNGHTQVNATDLRSLKYPSLQQLMALGVKIAEKFPIQEEIDALIERELLNVADKSGNDPITTKKRIEEALDILVAFGLPRSQLNERSALTLLALLDLSPNASWEDASNPLRGITQLMIFMDESYGKKYAPNTRETVRRQTVHQFLDAGLIVSNPDKPERPVNSPKTVYQIEESALQLLRTYGTKEWDKSIRVYLASVETLKKRYAQEREMARIPITIAGETKTLSPGGQNILVEQIISEFAPRFTPGGKLIYVGDTDEKFAHFDKEDLAALAVKIDAHGKMPDVIVHYIKKNWLVLIEAVTSHGPVNPKRKVELETLFKESKAGLVLVTAFLSRKAMVEYCCEISWETEVWIAESPSHLIHFNGERFLGPY